MSLILPVIQTGLSALNKTACQFLGTLYADSTHPRPQGKLLLTDLLINYLVEAVEFLNREVH